MRKQVRHAVLGLVVLLLGAVAFLVGQSLWRQGKQRLTDAGLQYIPGVSQHIRDFHRVKMQAGRKVWEVSAQDAQYLDHENVVIVRALSMQLFLRDGRTVGLKGDEGRIVLGGRELTAVEVNGGIEVSMADYTVHTEHATYDHSRRYILAPGAVEISGHDLELHGDRMEVDVEAQRLTLGRNVAMRLQPAFAKRRGGSNAL